MTTNEKFRFTASPKELSTLGSKDFRGYFEKWYPDNRLRAWNFSFDKQFQVYLKDSFCKDFMTDDVVLSCIECMASSGSWCRLPSKVHSVSVEEIPCTILSMDFFDRLKEYNIVRESGHISKCFDEYYEGIQISDELRKMLLLEDSDNYECYSEDERSELLFRLFSHICIGGPVCQYEDEIQPYLDVVKSLYKDCISVQKNSAENKLEILSKVYKVSAQDENGTTVYPASKDHDQTFAYLIIEPLRRQVIVLYHSWGEGFW